MSDDIAQGATRCRHCGSDVRTFADPGRVVSLDIWDAAAIRSFALGDDVGDRCPACGGVLSWRPNYILWDSHRPDSGADVLAGTHAPAEHLDALTAATVGAECVDVRVWKTHDQLRRALVTRTREAIELVNGFFMASGDARMDWLDEHWRDVDAPALITIPLALTGRLPGAGAVVASSDPDIDEAQATAWAHAELAQLETFLLLMLASRVAGGPQLSLTDELTRIVVPQVFEPQVSEFVTRAITAAADELHGAHGYVHLAVHAVMFASMGLEDPLADEWTEHYLEFEMAHATADALDRLSLPANMVGPTLRYESVWDALARRFEQPDVPWDTIAAVLDAAGHGEVMGQFLASVRSGGRLETPDKDVMADVLKRYPYDQSPDQFVWTTLGFLQQLMRASEPDRAEELLEAVLADDRLGEDARWMVVARFGQACKEAGLPARFLARVGDKPSSAESSVSDVVRLAVGVERSNAMRLEGRYQAALSALSAVEGLLRGEDDHRVFMGNKAILLRDSGEPDRSIEILEGLLPSAIGKYRLDLLESLIASHQQLGHHDAVHRYIDEAVPLAKGPLAERAPRLLILQLSAALNQGDVDSLREIEEFDPGESIETLLALAGAWATVVRGTLEYDTESLQDVMTRLVEFIDDQAGSIAYQMEACEALGLICEALELDEAVPVWEREVSLRRLAGSPEPLPLVALARHALLQGNEHRALDLLLELPEAMASMYGGIAHAGLAIDATRLLKEFLESLATTVVATGADPAVRRLAAELQRDGAGRAQLVRHSIGDRREQAALAHGLGNDVLRVLAPAAGRVHVIEWFTTDDGYFGQRTMIDANGAVDLAPLPPPEFDLWPIADRMRARLDGWHAHRTGEPFDVPEWLALEEWYREALGDVDPGDHVVVIDSPQHAGLPWHAVRRCSWTTSYAPGWSSLLTLLPATRTELVSVGVVVVPADEDPDSVVAELEAANETLVALARETGRSIASCVGTMADASALQNLLRTVDIAVILCHGYAAPDDQEVALMLSHDDALPTTHAVAAGSSARRPHRWSWRDAISLDRAPRLVVSAACSSGTSHLAGLGERLGLYGSLRLRGTQAIVAPLWDVVPVDARAFVTACLRAYLAEDLPLAQAMSAGSTTLQDDGVPAWRRNSFALEGDWR